MHEVFRKSQIARNKQTKELSQVIRPQRYPGTII